MKQIITILLAALLISCNAEKEKMLSAYEPMYDAYCSGDFQAVYEALDQESQTLIQRLVNNETPDSLIQIGKDYGLPNLAVIKYVYYPSDKDDPNEAYDFLPFLGYLGVSFLNPVETFSLYPERSRVGDENFVTLQKMVAGGYRHVEWLKYTLEGEEYKLNLPYVLRLNEPFFRDMVYNDINRLEVGKDFKYEDLYKNYKNYRDINFAKKFIAESCAAKGAEAEAAKEATSEAKRDTEE